MAAHAMSANSLPKSSAAMMGAVLSGARAISPLSCSRLVARAPPAAREGLAAELVLAADSFIITPVGRVADIVRAHAEGDEMRTVIAGTPADRRNDEAV